MWSLPMITQGFQLDPLSTQEFVDFQDQWSSANKTTFPESNFDTSEVIMLYDKFICVSIMLLYSSLMMSTKQFSTC